MKNKTKTAWWVGGSIAVVTLLLIMGHFTTSSPLHTIANPDNLPGIITGKLPWGTGDTGLRARLKAMGLSPLTREGTALHIHTHIAISINGKAVTVPAGVGINQIAGFISTIHTHRSNGIIHVESPTVHTFTLGQFFDTWGVRFTDQCIGGYCATATSSLRVYTNGKPYTGNPRLLPLKEREEIYISYGATTTPTTIPATYTFPTGD